MAKNKPGFVLYNDQREQFDALTDEEAGKLIKHTFAYVNDENPVTDDPMVRISFIPIKNQLKRDLKKYEATAERSRNNGSKGGRPRIENPAGSNDNLENPAGYLETQDVKKEPGKPVTDKVTDTVKEKVTVTEEVHTPDKPKRFVPPTLQMVTDYCLKRNNSVVPAAYMAHYESNGWMVGKNKMKDWMAAVRTWENNNINNTRNGQQFASQSKDERIDSESREFAKSVVAEVAVEWDPSDAFGLDARDEQSPNP